jgi:hypothetical protein
MGVPSLIRGCVCNLLVQLILGLASTVTLGSKTCRNPDDILLSPMRRGSPSIMSYNLQGYSGDILTYHHTGYQLLHHEMSYNKGNRMSPRDVTDKCATKSVAKHSQNGTII